ncbi:MAG: DUF5060 domain-containing protein [Candidatus Omnitrophica bacterium]|nr:DUF5060 domain-containing protein [Candidatus Omnitrophota bacterium]
MNLFSLKSFLTGVAVLFIVAGFGKSSNLYADDDFPMQTGSQWRPYLEWSLTNPSYEGNPYDVIAWALFRHEKGEERKTGMFYAGDNTWKFRFTGTKSGRWTFQTSSDDADLNGKKGTVSIQSNPDPKAHGFLTHFGNKWGWQGVNEAFTPQLVMYENPETYYGKPEIIDAAIQTFIRDHGFNGFHSIVLTRWFDLHKDNYDKIQDSDPNPDPRTFEALELLITKTHAAGGMVHLWAWGDEQRRMTPIKWGKNGKTDQRLQRYIAARLGPLPGWSMGYGFDLFEWVDEEDLKQWHDYMHEQMGWSHFLGGRSGGPRKGLDHSNQQISDDLDYSAYEHHRPTYEVYAAALDARPEKPSFSEDRFRIRRPSRYPEKDYDEEMTRRGLWHSTLAGGVANIWGNLIDAPDEGSMPYPHKDWFKTYSLFFQDRFRKTMIRDNSITDGVCLRTPDHSCAVFYKEDAESIRLDLHSFKDRQTALAVDALKQYLEIPISILQNNKVVWEAPYRSDWAIAVGAFSKK